MHIILESRVCQDRDSKGKIFIKKEEEEVIQEEGSIIEDIIEENQCQQEIFQEI